MAAFVDRHDTGSWRSVYLAAEMVSGVWQWLDGSKYIAWNRPTEPDNGKDCAVLTSEKLHDSLIRLKTLYVNMQS